MCDYVVVTGQQIVTAIPTVNEIQVFYYSPCGISFIRFE